MGRKSYRVNSLRVLFHPLPYSVTHDGKNILISDCMYSSFKEKSIMNELMLAVNEVCAL